MATVRKGNKGVLLIVDVQVGVMSGAWEASRTIKNVSRAVERARAHGVPVIWVQHSDEELSYGSAEWQLPPDLVPVEEELRIHKQFNSAFEQTPLEQELADQPDGFGSRRSGHDGHGCPRFSGRLRSTWFRLP